MNALRLLVIDPQNDFLDIEGAALPVPGANADMARLAGFVDTLGARIDDIVVTLDSHASVGIERTTFWITASGDAVAAFTAITAADVRSGAHRPRDPALLDASLSYLDALESRSGRTLVVWPVHCVLGTWGHNIHDGLAHSLARWESARLRPCDKVLKGLNPMTEQYSAFRAEVPRADDVRTQTNTALLDRLAAGDGPLLVAGEALSHCVAASGEDMLAHMGEARLRKTIFLTDCMSPVTGFEAQGLQFLAHLQSRGVQTLSTSQVLEALA
jgi:nicotinamidase-related amidase